MPARRFKVIVCRGPECGDRRGSQALQAAFAAELAARCLSDDPPDVTLETQSCFGRCSLGPNVLVREIPPGEDAPRKQFATLPGPRGVTALYNQTTLERVPRIVEAHIMGHRIVREFIAQPGPPGAPGATLAAIAPRVVAAAAPPATRAVAVDSPTVPRDGAPSDLSPASLPDQSADRADD